MTTGLVHDHLLVMRGAERTFAAIADVWPDASLYTLLYDEETTDGRFANREIHTALGKGAVRERGLHRLQRLFPWAVRRLPVAQHDVVISSSTGFAHAAHAHRHAVHVCYCHTPFRDAWSDRDDRLAAVQAPARPFAHAALGVLRRMDRRAVRRVTDFVANSALTRRRIEEFFGRESTVIHPPVEVDRFEPRAPEDYFLIVGELVPHKRVDLALEAAALAGKPVKVVGSGPEYRRLFAQFGDSAEFMRRLPDPDFAQLIAGAQALIVANVEEFGITAVEAQAAGRPVVGIDAGGLQETVIQGETGVLVESPTAEALADALGSVDFNSFNPSVLRDHARQFSVERFAWELRTHVDRVVAANG